jgi:hypothetical protein
MSKSVQWILAVLPIASMPARAGGRIGCGVIE